MANLIVQQIWIGSSEFRFLPITTRGHFPIAISRTFAAYLSARTRASGVAILMELAGWRLQELLGWTSPCSMARSMCSTTPTPSRSAIRISWALMARLGAGQDPPFHYATSVCCRYGWLDLKIHEETNSVTWEDTKPLVDQIWGGHKLHVNEFIPRVATKFATTTMPTISAEFRCNIIDFDYPEWHTERDTPDQCSARMGQSRLGA